MFLTVRDIHGYKNCSVVKCSQYKVIVDEVERNYSLKVNCHKVPRRKVKWDTYSVGKRYCAPKVLWWRDRAGEARSNIVCLIWRHVLSDMVWSKVRADRTAVTRRDVMSPILLDMHHDLVRSKWERKRTGEARCDPAFLNRWEVLGEMVRGK